MSAAENLKRQYQEALAAKRAELEAEIERENAAKRAKWEQVETAIFTQLAPFIPEGVRVEWKTNQTEPRGWLAGQFMVDSYAVEFIARPADDEPEVRINLVEHWQEAAPIRLAEYIGAELEYRDTLDAEREAAEARRAAYAAEEEKRGAEYAAESDKNRAEAAAREAANAAHDEAVEAKLLARKVAEAEAIAAAQAKHLVNPSGLTYDEISHMAQQALDTATDAGDRLPAVEQLRTEIGIFERQLKEAQAAAVWGTGGNNDTERKNNAARALAADPECKRLQAALDQMNRRLADIESEYRAVAMKSGAWRAVCELYAGWLQSLR